MKSGGSLGRGFIEHHVLCFFIVDAHTTSLCPVLAGVDHRLELRWGSGYEYHVIDIEEGSNPVEVVMDVIRGNSRSGNLARSSRISSATQMPKRVGLSRLPSGRPRRISLHLFGQ